MYAVIRAGGKQYRVAPGDVVRIEKLPEGDGETVKFSDVVAVSGQAGTFGTVKDAVVSAEVVETGRADKILVFHFKRKKQYKKIYGHRQPFTAIRITEIAFDGQSFKAPELAQRKKKAAPADSEAGEKHAAHKGKTAHKKTAARKPKAAKKHEAKKSAKAKKKK